MINLGLYIFLQLIVYIWRFFREKVILKALFLARIVVKKYI